jgi:hypothetical protein
MSTTPGAGNEYSRGSGGSKRPPTPRSAGGSGGSKGPSRGGSGRASSGSPKQSSGSSKQPSGSPAGAKRSSPAKSSQGSGGSAGGAKRSPAGGAKRSPPAGAKRSPRRSAAPDPAPAGWLPADVIRGAALAGALVGALLLIVAEFTSLYQVHTAASPLPVKIVGTGDNDSYALIPLALLAAGLGYAVYRSGSRPALLAIGIVGLFALLIALLGDLPDAQATGLVGTPTSHFVNASSTPSAGLYLETLGAVVLIATCVLGFMMLGRPEPRRRAGGDRPGGGQPGDRPARRQSVS